ncbi:alpha/beta-hydrolase [Ophiobolus disseminans]|uniref:Alpha/beta-hydrolase n=1 Tax=Ophiobolus disseminans TaxID=1469910 RepID=A0A6A6ZKF4_9PLEO|nr:alpha/beta-hydrolase [Ophiobolus disseminans]
MSKPIFVLLHGAWHTPRCWDKLVAELDKASYESVAPALPSSGSVPPTPDWSADVDLIRGTVSDLVEKGRDVIVVMHSFSGMTGGTALDGLDKDSRGSKELKGGVVRLIYVVAFLVPEGFQHSPHGTRDNMVSEMKTDLEAGIITVEQEDVKGMFYQDLDDNTVAELTKDLQPQSFGAFWSTTTHAAWRHIPTTYIICNADKPSTVMAAQYLVDTAKASTSHKIDNVIKVDAGHSPFISKPQWTASTLIEEAGKGV